MGAHGHAALAEGSWPLVRVFDVLRCRTAAAHLIHKARLRAHGLSHGLSHRSLLLHVGIHDDLRVGTRELLDVRLGELLVDYGEQRLATRHRLFVALLRLTVIVDVGNDCSQHRAHLRTIRPSVLSVRSIRVVRHGRQAQRTGSSS